MISIICIILSILSVVYLIIYLFFYSSFFEVEGKTCSIAVLTGTTEWFLERRAEKRSVRLSWSEYTKLSGERAPREISKLGSPKKVRNVCNTFIL